MKNTLLLLSCAMMAGSLWADDLTRAIQQRLKDQGFYYGEVDGQGGDETSAAIRRYQIRYGLRVTGQLNDETLHSLHLSRDSLAQPAPGYQDNGGPSNRQPESQYHQQPPYNAPYNSRPGRIMASLCRNVPVPRITMRPNRPHIQLPKSRLPIHGFSRERFTNERRFRSKRMCSLPCREN